MVKLAQHIEWSTPIPSKGGEGASSAERKKGDRIAANGKARKTLAELFESRATSSPFSSSAPSSLSLLSSSPPPSSTTATKTTPKMITTPSSVRAAPSLPSLSSAPVSSAATISASARASASCSPSSSRTPLPPSARSSVSSMHVHVTFDDKRTDKYHKNAHMPATHRSSELVGGIKRSSSARKIADSSTHEGTHLQANDPAKRSSKSGPLPRSPLTNASNSEPSRGISPAKLDNRHTNGKPNENLPGSSTLVQKKGSPSIAATILTSLEQRNRSPFGKSRIHEHTQGNFLQKSLDTVDNLQNLSRIRLKETDSLVDRTLDVESVVHRTPIKEKKVKKGLFGLLPDSGMAKHPGGEAKGTLISTWTVSGNLGKAADKQHTGAKIRDPRNSPKVTSGLTAKTRHMDVEMQNRQHPVSTMPRHSGIAEDCTESTSLTVEIPDKMVGLAWVASEPRLLPAGNYTFPADKFMLEQVVSEKSTYVKHGSLHRVCIPQGHLGVAWVDGKATLLEAGVSVHMCPLERFSYITTDEKMLSEKEFVLGPFRVVTVDESEVGIKFCNRQPQILYSGRHCLSISKVEVFAGFESLLRRQSYVNEANAMSIDNRKVIADAWVEWQIKAEDAAAARLANITDVEGALCSKVRRAFNLVIWEINAHDMEQQLTEAMVSGINPDPHPLLKTLSSNICRECQDLFEEGWTVTIWDLQLKHLAIEPEVKSAHGDD